MAQKSSRNRITAVRRRGKDAFCGLNLLVRECVRRARFLHSTAMDSTGGFGSRLARALGRAACLDSFPRGRRRRPNAKIGRRTARLGAGRNPREPSEKRPLRPKTAAHSARKPRCFARRAAGFGPQRIARRRKPLRCRTPNDKADDRGDGRPVKCRDDQSTFAETRGPRSRRSAKAQTGGIRRWRTIRCQMTARARKLVVDGGADPAVCRYRLRSLMPPEKKTD